MRLGKALATGIAEEAPQETTETEDVRTELRADVVEPLPEPAEAPAVR
ncbi:hypothetical protein [Streptomyces sp. NPDC046939]